VGEGPNNFCCLPGMLFVCQDTKARGINDIRRFVTKRAVINAALQFVC
jgi:uncharacterized protein YigE (DUF2233 family)